MPIFRHICRPEWHQSAMGQCVPLVCQRSRRPPIRRSWCSHCGSLASISAPMRYSPTTGNPISAKSSGVLCLSCGCRCGGAFIPPPNVVSQLLLFDNNPLHSLPRRGSSLLIPLLSVLLILKLLASRENFPAQCKGERRSPRGRTPFGPTCLVAVAPSCAKRFPFLLLDTWGKGRRRCQAEP